MNEADLETKMSLQDRAAWMLKRLIEAGWIEIYLDSGTMQTAYRFTAHGRQFSAPFAQRHTEIITNTQHTRSTLSHLQTFLTQLQAGVISVGDLMIASVNREIESVKRAGDNLNRNPQALRS